MTSRETQEYSVHVTPINNIPLKFELWTLSTVAPHPQLDLARFTPDQSRAAGYSLLWKSHLTQFVFPFSVLHSGYIVAQFYYNSSSALLADNSVSQDIEKTSFVTFFLLSSFPEHFANPL